MKDEHQDPLSDPKATPEPSGGSFIPLAAVRPVAKSALDLSAVKATFRKARGRDYWRSVDELAETPEFREYLSQEFPHGAPRDMEPLGRRTFLKLMGASLALAGVAGCGYQPQEKIVPYVKQPVELVPGKPLFFATAFTLGGYALGALAESHMGRPVKLEGNPDHPASLGATSALMQASLLTLYDPDRSQTVRHMGDPSTWESYAGTLTAEVNRMKANGGAGLRILTETVTSPTLAYQLQTFATMYPAARWHQYEPVNRGNIHAGARAAFGVDVQPVYRFDLAARVVALDSDFLMEEPGSLRYAHDFMSRRRVRKGVSEMNRLYAVESAPTITGATADHRLPVQSRRIEDFARALAENLGVEGVTGSSAPEGVPENWIPALAKDLQAHRGASIVLAGPHQPPVVHSLCHAINAWLGNRDKTVFYIDPVEVSPTDQNASLRALVTDMEAGRVDTLVILGGANPAYTAPADVAFAAATKRVRLNIHHGLYDDETGVLCQWHIPESHYLEGWGDARSYEGTASLVQPLIKPLYESRSIHEMMAVLLGQGSRYGLDIVQEYWRTQNPGAEFTKWWSATLNRGVVANSAAQPKTVTLRPDYDTGPSPAQSVPGGMELVLRPDPTVWDGRYCNNAWLQEMPKPITKLTWDNAALISAATAQKLGLNDLKFTEDRGVPGVNGTMVELAVNGRKLAVPVWIAPGHADDSITLSLGYGRQRAGNVGNDTGFNAYTLLTSASPAIMGGLEAKPTGDRYLLVSTQTHFNMHGRDLVRVGTLEEWNQNPAEPEFMKVGEEHEGENPTIYAHEWPSDRNTFTPKGVPDYKAKGYNNEGIPAWGMVIDTSACIGCNACMMACQAENNIATVGKAEVKNSRQMHWLRIDTYFNGEDTTNPETYFQPLPCMHCENAPCEPVCPVEATSHSVEGINEQTYNRCIGTRYCSNNCPYKVRRFNFLQYSDQKTPSIQMMRNPDVTVRSRGVMEKCTYCIQRINEARIQAEKEERPIRDGDVVTACAQSCPTQAIVFGNINDKASHKGAGSRVRQLKAEPLNYGILTELNTMPRTTYLARLVNPNPDLPRAAAPGARTTKGEG